MIALTADVPRGSRKRSLMASVAMILLSACGGSGGGGAGGPAASTPPPNQPPTFTSAASVNVVENTSGEIYRPAASDPEGRTVTYSIAGGADAARFVLDNGQLRFVGTPNYDLPTDADENNVYAVQIGASDGSATSTMDLLVTVTNDREGIRVRRIASGFDQPMGMVAIPGDSRFFVPERGGRIYIFDPVTGTRTLFMTISVSTAGEGGLAAIAPLATYATTGQFLVLYTSTNGYFLAQFGRRSGTVGSPELTYETAATAVLPAGSSATGWAQLGPDGKVYFATSDALGAAEPSGGSVSTTSMFGKLFVVEPNPDPYAGATPQFFVSRRIAAGLRFPRGGAFIDGRLVLADRGADTWQEANTVDLNTGGNFGWPYREGTQSIRSDAPANLIDPVVEYRYGAGPAMGTGIVGGVPYRGAITSLAGFYVFADQRGEIFTVPLSRIAPGQTSTASVIERRRLDFAPDAGEINRPTAIVADAAGVLYVLDGDGDVFRVEPG